ncbi:MAG: hypothetical protein IJG84_18435 [Kiritimatiellae bacterium]|nr:hypothetical protein [Kiritimatiellia bacterium]
MKYSAAYSTGRERIISEELAEMGRRGRQLVDEKYTWPAVVKPMIDAYNRIVGNQYIEGM